MNSDDESPYEVGYGRPPRQHRFRKGQSGNPRGRPRKPRGQQAVFDMVMDEPVRAVINGRVRKMSAFEAIIRGTVAAAMASRRLSDLERLLRLCDKYGVRPAEDRSAEAEAEGMKVVQRLFEYFDKTVPDDPPGGDDPRRSARDPS